MAIEDFIPGTDKLVGALGRFALRLEARAGKVDGGAAGEMVAEMRAAVPVDSGNLLNGITTYREGESTVVEASAIRGDFDYARVIEFGRHADTAFFARDGFGEGSGAAKAEPFFFPAVNDVLEERGSSMDEAIEIVAGEEGLA